MKDQETVQKFIELRSKGSSFARIADQLGVAKSTLILWSREHQHLIQNLRTIEWEDFVDRTLASKQERLKALSD
jgi:orotate phosphoribosyltransferase-like protein